MLAYGPGSKRNVLEDFSRRCREHGAVVVVNGYSPNTNLKSIVREIVEKALPHELRPKPTAPLSSLLRQCQYIKGMFSDVFGGERSAPFQPGAPRGISGGLEHGPGTESVSSVVMEPMRGTDERREKKVAPGSAAAEHNHNECRAISSKEDRPLRRRNLPATTELSDHGLYNMLWPKLHGEGWTHSAGRNLASYAFHRPGFPKKKTAGDEGKTWFNGISGLVNFVKSERPELVNEAVTEAVQRGPGRAAALVAGDGVETDSVVPGARGRNHNGQHGIVDSDMHTRRLYLILHNIDGSGLRAPATQHALSVLASAARVHMVASIDHANAPLLWNQALSGAFCWTWHNVSTYDAYVHETSASRIALGLNDSGNTAGATRHILRSLTPNHIRVLRILADHQRGNATGLTFHDLYARCREEMLVNSDFTLRSLLTEFQDHELVTLHSNMYRISKQVLNVLVQQ